MPTWTCPRCRGTDSYSVSEQQMYNGVIARDEWYGTDIYGAKVRDVNVKKCRQCAEKMRLEVTADDKQIFQEKMLRHVRERFNAEAENSVKQNNQSDFNHRLIEKDVDKLVAIFRNIFLEKLSAFSESDYLRANYQNMVFEGFNLVNREERFQRAVAEFRLKYPYGELRYQAAGGFPKGLFFGFLILALSAVLILGI